MNDNEALGHFDNLTDRIIEWEEGTLSEQKTLVLFAYLISSGLAWTLQGMYGRQAKRFIDAGLISPKGHITTKGLTYGE